MRDMELNLDNYSRTDMKTIYNSAHEIQMRLFMMRAQVEQLEVKRNSMKTLQQRLQRVTAVLLSAPEGYNPGSSTQAMRPMVSGPLHTLPEPDDSSADSKMLLAQDHPDPGRRAPARLPPDTRWPRPDDDQPGAASRDMRALARSRRCACQGRAVGPQERGH